MWLVNSKTRSGKVTDPDFMPFPEEFEKTKGDVSNGDAASGENNVLANKAMVLQFVKSPASVNPHMTKQEHIYLQGEDRIYLNLGYKHQQHHPIKHNGLGQGHALVFGDSHDGQKAAGSLNFSGGKHWTTIIIPHNYIGSSWPIRVIKYLKYAN